MHEKTLGKRFHDVLRRRYGAIGDRPCQQQLSADEVTFINGIPGVPLYGISCSVNAASAGAIETDVLTAVKRRRLLSKTRADAPSAQAFCALPIGELRRAVKPEVAQSTTGEAVSLAAELVQVQRWQRLVLAIVERYKRKGTEHMKEQCHICHTKTENPQRLSGSPECPYIACTLRCLNDLHCKWIDIKAGLVQANPPRDAIQEIIRSIPRPMRTRTTEVLKARGGSEQKHKEMMRGSRVPNSWLQVNDQKKQMAFTVCLVFSFSSRPY